MICRDTPTHGWVCGWMGGSVGQWVGSGHITKYQINLDLIETIQFCLKIYDLWRLFLVIPGPFEYFSENGCSQKIGFLDEGVIITPLISFVLGGEVPRLNHGPICFPIQNT